MHFEGGTPAASATCSSPPVATSSNSPFLDGQPGHCPAEERLRRIHDALGAEGRHRLSAAGAHVASRRRRTAACRTQRPAHRSDTHRSPTSRRVQRRRCPGAGRVGELAHSREPSWYHEPLVGGIINVRTNSTSPGRRCPDDSHHDAWLDEPRRRLRCVRRRSATSPPEPKRSPGCHVCSISDRRSRGHSPSGKDTTMFENHPQYLRVLVDERHARLREQADAPRRRRQARQASASAAVTRVTAPTTHPTTRPKSHEANHTKRNPIMYSIHPELRYAVVEDRQRDVLRSAQRSYRQPVRGPPAPSPACSRTRGLGRQPPIPLPTSARALRSRAAVTRKPAPGRSRRSTPGDSPGCWHRVPAGPGSARRTP